MPNIQYRFWGIVLVLGLVGSPMPPAFSQDVPGPETATEATTESSSNATNQYFADVIVKGRPVFQVGSLSELSAGERAEIINRRIASLLSRSDEGNVQVETVRGVPTLQFNNRMLMTVTPQDADDYGLSVDALAQDWAQRLNEAFDTAPLAIDVAQRLSITVRELSRKTIEALPVLVGALVVLAITWVAAKGVRYIVFRWAQKTEGDHSTEVLIGRLGYGGVWIVGLVIALGVMGLDFGALLGALGLTSVAIGFSLKDVLSNYISGVILLAARPFRLQDQVVIDNYEGTITQIQLRATTMKTYDGRMVYIPNQEVFGASIINNTASQIRRSSVMVGIDYDADISEAIQIIKTAVNREDLVEASPASEVLVRELAASTVNLEVRFWVNSHRGEFLAMTSEVVKAIKEALQQGQIEMPTDIYTLIFRDAPVAIKEATELSQDVEAIDAISSNRG